MCPIKSETGSALCVHTERREEQNSCVRVDLNLESILLRLINSNEESLSRIAWESDETQRVDWE